MVVVGGVVPPVPVVGVVVVGVVVVGVVVVGVVVVGVVVVGCVENGGSGCRGVSGIATTGPPCLTGGDGAVAGVVGDCWAPPVPVVPPCVPPFVGVVAAVCVPPPVAGGVAGAAAGGGVAGAAAGGGVAGAAAGGGVAGAAGGADGVETGVAAATEVVGSVPVTTTRDRLPTVSFGRNTAVFFT